MALSSGTDGGVTGVSATEVARRFKCMRLYAVRVHHSVGKQTAAASATRRMAQRVAHVGNVIGVTRC
ncbi:hypothetical protein TR80_008635 [Xanthomonas campestris]|nr:hypothetical protein TR80_008635 [Xanthomonas campestris]